MSQKKISKLNPPSTIGIIGGGQLGRMLVLDAKRMGYNVIVFDPKPNSPAGQVADEQITAIYGDLNALRNLARKTDVITYEFEHIDVELLTLLEYEGYTIYPSAKTLRLIQNKFVQKSMLNNIGIKVPEFYLINTLKELRDVFYKFGQKAILKTCRDGYDGKGNLVLNDINKLEENYQIFRGLEIMAEEFIHFTKEVSIIVAKNHDDIVLYPIAENFHENSILINSLIPANISVEIEKQIHIMSKKIVEELDDFGIFCIEFFIDSDSNVLVNEIAPRPHNSGHYTIEGCVSSQFEQHIRIITGMPLGSPKLRLPCAMYNILGNEHVAGTYSVRGVDAILNIKDCHFHLYGKLESKHLKKIGHITVLDDSVGKANNKAKIALSKIKID
jgi:5-(carboxyamino)imidazole ribonucleotide synthase